MRGALFLGMRAWRRGPAGIRAADRPDGAHDDPSPLDVLLAAVTAPPSPAELAGERQAVAGFVQARREQPRRTGSHRPAVRARLRRAVAVKVAVGLTVALAGGTGYAAQSGRLPASTQQRVHDALPFLPPPAPPHGTPVTSPTPSDPTNTPGHPPSVGATTGPHVVELCLAWRDRDASSPGSAALTSSDLAALVSAAGAQAHITDFCAQVLGGTTGSAGPAGTPAAPTRAGATPVTPTPGHPGGSPPPHPVPKH